MARAVLMLSSSYTCSEVTGQRINAPCPAIARHPSDALAPPLRAAESFGRVDLAQLQFPSQYKLDYVRVYQKKDALNIGCSPPGFPTAQYMAW
jgi:hypothetical protein